MLYIRWRLAWVKLIANVETSHLSPSHFHLLMWYTLLLWWKIPLGLLGVKLLVLAAKFAEQVVNRECFHLVVKPEKYLQHFSQFMKGTITFLLALINLRTCYTSFFLLWICLGKNISFSEFVLENCSSSFPNVYERNLQYSPCKLKKLLSSTAQIEAVLFIFLKAVMTVKARAA